ncbi:YihY/virulence factor BrkB family protein [Hyphobacterium indicum]|uniref:YihY/virulence factor BrkB family protein n=1 Tax=Hyphobacterium indicum TaxID=2162714 RepID=UPI000D649FFB|nr:YihY/virulence factor BrkB family protein [Hyphobacterium indicum]
MKRFHILADIYRDLIKPVLTWPPLAIVIASVSRTMAREVMLFAGGVSFFTLLAIFPLIAVAAVAYGLIFDATDASQQLARLSSVMPESAQAFVETQIAPLAGTSRTALSLQGLLALTITVFAASRGAKALIAGLNQIAGMGDFRNVIKFNVLAIMTVIVGGVLLIVSNIMVLAIPNIVRPAIRWLGWEISILNSVFNEWTAVSVTMISALVLLYRYLMRRAGEISWIASLIAASTACGLWLSLSAGFSYYVSGWVNPTAYGSIGALIVFLLWIYWGSYTVFFGGAMAVEIDKRRLAEQRHRE